MQGKVTNKGSLNTSMKAVPAQTLGEPLVPPCGMPATIMTATISMSTYVSKVQEHQHSRASGRQQPEGPLEGGQVDLRGPPLPSELLVNWGNLAQLNESSTLGCGAE